MRSQLLRKLTALLTVAIIAVAFIAVPQAMAQDTAEEAAFLDSLNAERAAGGLEPLTFNDSMGDAAENWTQQMVNGSFLEHAADIDTGAPSSWIKVGENVGRGQTVTTLTTAFMNSPTHRANIMDDTYTHVGIAVVAHPSDGRIYTTHRFANLPAPAPAPVVEEAPAPAPAPEVVEDAPAVGAPDFGEAPETLAFVNPAAEEAPAAISPLANAKLVAKISK